MILTLREVESILRCSALSFVVICIINILSASTASSIKPKYDFGDYKILEKKMTLNLECEIPAGVTSEIMWTKDNNTNPITSNDKYKVSGTTLTIEKSSDADTGNYTCRLSNKTIPESSAVIQVVSLPISEMDVDVTVIEGEKLTLDCKPFGKPIPLVEWKIGNNSYTSSSGRIELLTSENGVPNGKLIINETAMTDRGEYRCYPSNIVNTEGNRTIQFRSTKIRVKDKLAALWPFLGICAEVFVLCAIILIYEKKRNKAELDESDTDNSPEQKNTPDHGKDSVRQRK